MVIFIELTIFFVNLLVLYKKLEISYINALCLISSKNIVKKIEGIRYVTYYHRTNTWGL